MSDMEAFFDVCERKSIRVALEYDTGRYIPGEYLRNDDNSPTSEEYQRERVQQGPVGWTIEVNMRSFVDRDGKQILHPSIREAIIAGFRLLALSEEED